MCGVCLCVGAGACGGCDYVLCVLHGVVSVRRMRRVI